MQYPGFLPPPHSRGEGPGGGGHADCRPMVGRLGRLKGPANASWADGRAGGKEDPLCSAAPQWRGVQRSSLFALGPQKREAVPSRTRRRGRSNQRRVACRQLPENYNPSWRAWSPGHSSGSRGLAPAPGSACACRRLGSFPMSAVILNLETALFGTIANRSEGRLCTASVPSAVLLPSPTPF